MGPTFGSVLFQARLRRCGSREGFAAQFAAQLLQLETRRGKQGLGGNAHDLGGPFERVEFALPAVRTRIARMELRVGHFDPFGPGVVGGGRAAMTFTLGRRRCRRPRGARGRRLGKKPAGFLGLGSEDHPRQTADGGVLGFDGAHEPLEGAQYFFE